MSAAPALATAPAPRAPDLWREAELLAITHVRTLLSALEGVASDIETIAGVEVLAPGARLELQRAADDVFARSAAARSLLQRQSERER